MWELATGGIVLGGVASLHCVAMCGPIALMLPHPSTRPLAIAADNLAYNIGRASTYSLFGLLAGIFGSLVGLDALQSSLSLAIGIAIILGYAIYRWLPTSKLPFAGVARGFAARIKRPFAKLLQRRSRPALFGLGMLNGLLPCGMVYAALSMAAVLASPAESAFFMLMYGLGTFPAMTALYLLPKTFRGRVRGVATRALPVMLVLMGSVLILRGMNLGWGMLSPEAPTKATPAEMCNVGR